MKNVISIIGVIGLLSLPICGFGWTTTVNCTFSSSNQAVCSPSSFYLEANTSGQLNVKNMPVSTSKINYYTCTLNRVNGTGKINVTKNSYTSGVMVTVLDGSGSASINLAVGNSIPSPTASGYSIVQVSNETLASTSISVSCQKSGLFLPQSKPKIIVK
jgi:hypothetical protein